MLAPALPWDTLASRTGGIQRLRKRFCTQEREEVVSTKTALALATIIAFAACKSPPPDGRDEPDPEQPAAAEEAPAPSGADTPADPPEQEAEAQKPTSQEGPSLVALGQPQARLKVNPPAPVLYRKAKKARKDDDDETARQLLDQALEADPHFAWALLLRARLHMDDGEKQKCLEKLERLVAYNYMEYVPRIQRRGWLEPLRQDEELWPAFQEKVEAYRQAWIEALDGPGAFFIQSQYKNVQQTDLEGEDVDLRWKRGSLVFWSKDLGRHLVLGEYTDVAGFLHDRNSGKLVFIRWDAHPDLTPGMMGVITAQRMDLTTLEMEGKPVVLAAEADEARFALAEDGQLLFQMHVPATEAIHDTVTDEKTDDHPSASGEVDEQEVPEDQQAVHEDDEPAGPEEAEEEDDDTEATDEEIEDEQEKEGVAVDAVDWSDSKIVQSTMDEDSDWLLVIRLGETQGPEPASSEDAPGDPPTVRHGHCFYMDAETAFCFAPTKKGGTWAHLEVRPADADPVQITDEPIPLVQF